MRHVPGDEEELGPEPVDDADDSRQTLDFHLMETVSVAQN